MLNTAFSNDVGVVGIIRPLVAAILIGLALTVLFAVLFRNRWDGALVASALILVVVSPVSLAWPLFVLRGLFGDIAGAIVTALSLVAILGGAAAYLLRRHHRGLPFPRPPTDAVQVMSAVLVAIVIGTHIASLPQAATRFPALTSNVDPAKEPDIVLILLDGYPRTDVLDRRLGVDNEAFLNALRQRGFDVGTTNRSNYALTELTLPSMFQMRYLDEIPSVQPLIGSDTPRFGALRAASEAGQVFSTLRRAGYEIVISSSGWEHVTLREAADRLLDSGELTDLERTLLHRTWLLYLLNVVSPNFFADQWRDRIVHSFDALDEFADERRDHPTFLFLHVPAPHPPIVVRADGSTYPLPDVRFESIDRDGFDLSDDQYSRAWQGEITYINARLLEGVDRLLAGSERDTTIVVMSDHGYNFETDSNDLQSRFGNLFAARTPGASGLTREPPTLVNLFRVLFNQYLGTHLELLPDRYFLQGQQPLHMEEVRDPEMKPPGSS